MHSTLATGQRPSLWLNSGWMLAGNLVYALSQWAMITAIAKLGTPEMVGQFVLALAITTPVNLFTSLQLRQVQATDVAGQYSLGQYVRLRMITVALSILAVGLILRFVSEDATVRAVVLGVAFFKGFEALSDILHGYFQKLERLNLIATSLMLKGPLAVAALGLTLWATRSLLCAVLGTGVAFAFMVLFDARRALRLKRARPIQAAIYLLRSFRPGALRVETRVLAKIFRTSFPLGLANTIGSLAILVPRYSVDHYLGTYELGIYGAIAYWQQAGAIVVNAVGQAAIPRMAALFDRGMISRFVRIQVPMLLLGGGLGAAGWAVAALYGRTLLTVLYRPAYADSVDTLRWQMVSSGAAFVAAFAQTGLTSMRAFTVQLPLFIAVTAISCGVSYLLVPRIGLTGAPIATLCAMAAQAIIAFSIMASRLRSYRAFIHA